MTFTYRRATPADVLIIADFRWRLKTDDSATESVKRRSQFISDFVNWFDDACDHSRTLHWVAETEGRLSAIATVVIVNKVASPDNLHERWGYLTNVYALPEIRNRGVGADLLGEIKNWALSEGLEMLVVWPSDRSYSLYERVGFRRNADPLVLDLKGI